MSTKSLFMVVTSVPFIHIEHKLQRSHVVLQLFGVVLIHHGNSSAVVTLHRSACVFQSVRDDFN